MYICIQDNEVQRVMGKLGKNKRTTQGNCELLLNSITTVMLSNTMNISRAKNNSGDHWRFDESVFCETKYYQESYIRSVINCPPAISSFFKTDGSLDTIWNCSLLLSNSVEVPYSVWEDFKDYSGWETKVWLLRIIISSSLHSEHIPLIFDSICTSKY